MPLSYDRSKIKYTYIGSKYPHPHRDCWNGRSNNQGLTIPKVGYMTVP